MSIFKIVILIMVVIVQQSFAGSSDVGTRFNYQGELLDNGSPANGTYDLIIQLYDAASGGTSQDFNLVNDIEISNGLINTELDFGDTPFMGEERYLELSIRPGNSTAGYNILSPRTRINATPYAIQSSFTENVEHPWEQLNDGGIRSINDISVGMGSGSQSSAKATINSALGQDPLRVRISGGSKFVVQADGGVAVGTNQAAPENGLLVNGEVRQALNRRGFVKAGLTFVCGNSGTTIESQFNNVSGGDFIVTSNLPENGRCEVTAPFDISDVYLMTTTFAVNFPRGVSCGKTTNGGGDAVIECNAYNPLSGNRVDALVTLLLF